MHETRAAARSRVRRKRAMLKRAWRNHSGVVLMIHARVAVPSGDMCKHQALPPPCTRLRQQTFQRSCRGWAGFACHGEEESLKTSPLCLPLSLQCSSSPNSHPENFRDLLPVLLTTSTKTNWGGDRSTPQPKIPKLDVQAANPRIK